MRFNSESGIFICIWLLIAASVAAAELPLRIQEREYNLAIFEGTTVQPVNMPWQRQNGLYAAKVNDLQVSVGPLKDGLLTEIPVQVRNAGATERLVELRLEHRARVPAAQWWDGWVRVTSPIEGLQRLPVSDMHSGLPLAALGSGEQAVAMGRAPEPLNSYFKPVLHYRAEGISEFSYSLRMVLAPGQTDRVAFVAGTVATGGYDLRAAAWQAYMDTFPAYFRPTPGVSEAALGSSIQYQSWNVPPDLEALRRMRTTWDWCYAPFKRAGDMWGRSDDWDYTPLKRTWEGRKVNWLGGAELTGMSVEEFQKRRAEYFEQWGYDAGQMFYNPSGAWVERQLAEKSFPDAIAVNPSYQTERGPWVTFWDSEVLVQPQGTSYWPRLEDDIRRIASGLDVCGFAFDVFSGVSNYGPGARLPLPGRAWDERGIYVDIGIGMIEQAKLIHSLKPEGKPFERFAVVGGGGQCGFFSDAGLLELTLYGGNQENYPLQRMSLGSKPAVMWKGWSLASLLPNLETMSRREFLDSFAKIADYVRLKAFQWGIYPTYPYIVGVEPMQRDMPLLVELVANGWQPLAPVTVATEPEAEVWLARYGRPEQGAIAIANPQEQALQATVTVAPVPGQTGAQALVNWRSPEAPLAQQVGSSTKLSVSLPARGATVLRSAWVLQTPQSLDCRASVQKTLEQAVSELVVVATGPVSMTVRPSGLPGYGVPAATLDGAALAASGQCRLRAGTHIFRAIYPSLSFHLSQAALDAFPFTEDNGRIGFSLVVQDPQSRVAKRVARRLEKFFAKVPEAAVGADVNLPVLTDLPAQPAPTVVLQLTDRQPAGWRMGQTSQLILTAPDEAQAVALTLRLLEALEPRYPWVVPFKPYAGMPARFGLLDKTLYQAMREEGLPCGQ